MVSFYVEPARYEIITHNPGIMFPFVILQWWHCCKSLHSHYYYGCCPFYHQITELARDSHVYQADDQVAAVVLVESYIIQNCIK